MGNTINVNYMSNITNQYAKAFSKKTTLNMGHSGNMADAIKKVSSAPNTEKVDNIAEIAEAKPTSKEDMTLEEYKGAVMSLAVQSNLLKSNYANHYTTRSNDGTGFGDTFIGKATSPTTSSSNGKNIGITTVGNVGYIAMYADSSTNEEPIIKVGDYEVRVNDVNPKNATRMEMFALMSYMDDVGLSDNHGMKSFNKMTAYTDGGYGNIADASAVWYLERDWTAELANAKEVFMGMPQTYQQGLNCQSIIDNLEKWSMQISSNGEREERIHRYADEEWENLLASVDEQIGEMKKTNDTLLWN